MSKEENFNLLKEKVKKINSKRDEIITNAYTVWRDTQKKAKQDAIDEIKKLEEKPTKK
jgi:vacuolar-type H+-ATPase subunit H